MASLLIVGAFIVVVLIRIYKYSVYRPENFPPGPFRVPIFGSYLLLLLINHKNLHNAIEKLCKFYRSTVIGFYTGDMLTVVVNDKKSIREALFNPDLDGRNDIFIGRLREPDYKLKGIFFTDGAYWSEQRRFTLRHLRDFGFGRRYQEFEAEVKNELESLVSMIKGGPKFDHEKEFLNDNCEILLPKALIGSLGNCFIQVLSGDRFARADQAQMFKAGYGSMAFQVHSNEYGLLFSLMPWIRFFFPEISSFKQLRDGSMQMCDLMRSIIDRNVQTYQEGHIRSFIDLYIKEMHEAQEKNAKTGFLHDQLLMICTDFVFPSLSAIETTISFLFRYLLSRPDVLKLIHDELDAVVGSGRLPELDDRIK